MASTIVKIILLTILVKFSYAKNCTCVPFYQCSDDYTIISDGRGLIEIRNSECEGFLNVCCTVVSITSTETPPKKEKGCGFQNSETFPWSAALLYKQYPNFVPSYKCRVSLIHEKVAITAAHCLEEKGYYLVRIGSTLRSVVHINMHPFFKMETLQNDIALLLLNKPFKAKFGTVCIPPPETVLDGTNCTTVTKSNKEKENLSVIQLPVVRNDDCVEKLRKSKLGSFFQLHPSFVCAGGGDKQDTCGGDGGSPLICPIPGVPRRFQQVGIVSWGIGCGEDYPGVYVNLGHFRDWIDEIMTQNGLDINSYRL